MVLNNVLLIDNNRPVNVQIGGDKITNVTGDTIKDQEQIQFDNALIFPGLINSHDHLDFNLFPQLGDKIYNNYTEWGKHIHENYKDEILKVLNVPLLLREQWGIIKNLLCGVTTVVNHGEKIKTSTPLINVYERYHCLHSVGFEKNWRIKLNNPFKKKLPVVIHVGEGTDDDAYREINQLIQWNRLCKKLIGVHAVAMSNKQAEKFRAIVWCPQSNYFLLNKTAPVNQLKNKSAILLGTDSTLTGNWNIWDHIAVARKTGMLTDLDLYNALHINASTIWKTNTKKIEANNDADIVVAKINNGQKGLDAYFATEPKDILLVIHKGNIRLFDASLYDQLIRLDLSSFSKIYISGVCKYIQSDVPMLMSQIRQYYQEANFPIGTHPATQQTDLNLLHNHI